MSLTQQVRKNNCTHEAWNGLFSRVATTSFGKKLLRTCLKMGRVVPGVTPLTQPVSVCVNVHPWAVTALCLKEIAALFLHIVRAPIDLLSALGEKGDVLGAVDVSFFHKEDHP
jgi:hypothetical protein